ncbi:MAG: gamma-glutamyl-phosphate reductase, partial [Oscillospiraceae bacterium]|nr:gamma-glutamyl-phosphate reductase [Oscillospiraceae bacterium]
MQELLTRARSAKAAVASLSTQQKNAALAAMAQSLLDEQDAILAANRQDLKKARGTVSDVMLDRLALSPQRIADMAKGILEVAALPDPVGLLLDSHTRSDGLLIEKVSVPMGVIAIIYESRPNVTSDAAALALKAGSVCILRGGKE